MEGSESWTRLTWLKKLWCEPGNDVSTLGGYISIIVGKWRPDEGEPAEVQTGFIAKKARRFNTAGYQLQVDEFVKVKMMWARFLLIYIAGEDPDSSDSQANRFKRNCSLD